MKRALADAKALFFAYICVNNLLSRQKGVGWEEVYKTKVLNLAIARHYILMQFSTLNCNLLLNEELAIITFSLVKK